MIRVTVNRDGLERGTARNPLLVWRPGAARPQERSSVELEGNVRVVYEPNNPMPDGARVWIEADRATDGTFD